MTPQELKQILQSKNLNGLALDIDETLANSNTHWFEKIYEFHPVVGMTVNDLLKKYKFAENVPEWGVKETLEQIQRLLHSGEFNETIPIIEDANHTVNKINKITPIAAYITARPGTVRNATEIWLRKHGFPDAPLLMRGDDVQISAEDGAHRNKWKAQILVDLYPYVNGIIDDNITLSHELHELNYPGTVYVYGTETDELDYYSHVVVCPTWNSVLEKITSQ